MGGGQVSIPKRVSEVLWLMYTLHDCNNQDGTVSIPKRVSEVLWRNSTALTVLDQVSVSIPKRVSEVLWLRISRESESNHPFQSLKGFQRFCGRNGEQQSLNEIGFNP